MCGIAGIINREMGDEVPSGSLESMARAMIHRGPDSDGFHRSGPVGFAFRRLAIIDVAGGDQPIENEDGSVVVVFNGEIYNYRDLREQLVAKGHVFRSDADTEAIVHGYEEWGVRGICERLRGMFAFAIHDISRNRVVLARDRLGIKPLYFGSTSSGIAFSSELKSLLSLPDVARRVSAPALIDYASLGYVPAPRTIFEDIEKLRPGHLAVIEGGSLTLEKYWEAPFEESGVGIDDAARRISEILDESVRLRLMSEVPLGCFLSGGLDSSAVAASMVKALGTSLTAVTVGFADQKYDERGAARRVAQSLGIRNSEEQVNADASVLDGIADTYDEPHADPSNVPTWLLCMAARRQVTVALSGDGGDELFGGYRRYIFDRLENRIRAVIPGVVRRAVFSPLGSILPKGDRLPRGLRAKTFVENLARDPLEGYFRSVSRIIPEEVELLLDPDILNSTGGYRTRDLFRDIDDRRALTDPLFRIRALDMETWLPDDILCKVDRASMAHSLEVRVPVLDHVMVEYASSLPSSLLIRHGSGKSVFKHSQRGVLPDDIIDRTKQGFDLPIEDWLSTSLKEELRALGESGSSIEGFFNPRRVKELIHQHQSGHRNRHPELWAMLMFGRWRRRWLDSS